MSFFVLEALFALFKTSRFSRGKLAAFHAVGDAVLLVGFPGVDFVDPRMAGIDLVRTGAGGVGVLSNGTTDDHQRAGCQDKE